MADLGNLFFSLGLKTDDIDAAWNKALEKYKKEAKIVLKLDTKEVTAAQQQTKMDIESSKRKVLVKKEEQQIEREINKTKQANLLLEEKIRTQAARTQSVRDRSAGAINRANTALSTQNRLMQNLHTMAASYISIFAGARLVRELVRITGEFEMQKVALQAILGDLVGANKIFDQVKQLAVKSPFQFKDLVSYTKQLSAFSIPMNELYDTTKMLADVSAGLGVGMDRLVLAYGQIRAASVLRGQEVRQLTEAGIPVIEELRKKFEALGETGITAADVFDKISARLVPFEMIKEMFTDMTSEGGKFFQMQEIQAETLKGKVSNLTDAYQIMMAEIGESDGGIMKTAVDTARALIENYETIGRVLTVLVATYGVYQAGLLVTAVANGTLMTSNGLLVASIVGVRNAITALNIAIATNPYLALALAVTTIVGSMWALRDSSTAAEKAQAKLAKTMESLAERRSKMSTDVSSLIGTITSETTSVYEQVKAWDELIRRYDFFSKYSIDKLRSMSENERKSIIASFLQQDDKESLKILYDNKKKEVDELAKLYDKHSSIAMDIAGSVLGIEFPVTSGDIFAQQYADAWRIANQELKGIEQQLQKVNELERQAEFQQKPEVERIAIYNARLRELKRQKELAEKEAPEGVGKDRLLDALKKNILDTEKELSKFRQSEVVKNKEFWEEQKKTAEGVISGFSSETLKLMRAGRFGDVKPELAGAYKKAMAEIAEADKMLGIYEFGDGKKRGKEDNDKAIQGLEQRLAAIEKIKRAYQELVGVLGGGNEDIAANFINNLFGTAYTQDDFGTGFKSAIEPIIADMSLLGEKGREAADKIRVALTDATNTEAIKRYVDKIKEQNDARERANKLLTEQQAKEGELNRLIEERDAQMAKIVGEDEKSKALRQAIFDDYKKQILDIGKEWLRTLGLEGEAADFIKSKIKEIVPLFKSIDKLSFSELGKVSDMLEGLEIDPKVLEFLKIFGIDVEKLQEAIKTAAKTVKEEQVDPKKWQEIVKYVNIYASAIGAIGNELKDMGGVWGEIGGAIAGAASQADNLVTALDKGSQPVDKIGAGISAISNIILMVIQQAKENKKAQEDWNMSIIDGAHQMSLLRIEAEAYKESNLFGVGNPYEKAIAGATRYAVAMGELNKQFADAKVQTGTKKAVSGENTAIGFGAGAALGATIGGIATSWTGPFALIGAAIGAAVGGVAGLLTQKTVPVFESLTSKYGQIFNEKFELNPEILADYKKLDEATKQLIDNWEEIRKKALEAQEEMRATFKELAGDMGTQLSDALVKAFRNGDIYSAVDDYRDYVSNIIGDIISQLIFAAQFGKLFDDLEKRFNESFGAGGDQDIVDDILWFNEIYQGQIDEYNKAMEDAKKTLADEGIDIFKPDANKSTATPSTLGGSIQAAQMTENTANLIGSYINAIRADGARRTMFVEKLVPVIGGINDTMANGLTHLAAINANTFRSANNSGEILDKLNALTTPNSTTRLNATIKTS